MKAATSRFHYCNMTPDSGKSLFLIYAIMDSFNRLNSLLHMVKPCIWHCWVSLTPV